MGTSRTSTSVRARQPQMTRNHSLAEWPRVSMFTYVYVVRKRRVSVSISRDVSNLSLFNTYIVVSFLCIHIRCHLYIDRKMGV